ncbi:MAG: ornithine carbamoyltransferase [Planctomycetaceae bacterium]
MANVFFRRDLHARQDLIPCGSFFHVVSGAMKHLVNLLDLSVEDVQAILAQTAALKSEFKAGRRHPILASRVLAQVFEKPSLRTRVSFEAAMQQLGGSSIFLSSKDAGLGGRESIEDVARVLTSYCDVLVLRTFSHELIEQFAKFGRCPVVNGLSDASHPCQALTDLFTMQEECGGLRGKTMVYVGDGNNVAISLAEACAMLDVACVIAAPEGYQLPEKIVADLKQRFPKCDVSQTADPRKAVRNADVIYTDVWASMGQEAEKEARARIFADYQVNEALLAAAPKQAKFMHCLPARRGLEVTNAVMESPQSIVFEQAENRMHLAKGLFAWQLAD